MVVQCPLCGHQTRIVNLRVTHRDDTDVSFFDIEDAIDGSFFSDYSAEWKAKMTRNYDRLPNALCEPENCYRTFIPVPHIRIEK